jgi:hypothetical protein
MGLRTETLSGQKTVVRKQLISHKRRAGEVAVQYEDGWASFDQNMGPSVEYSQKTRL